MKFGQLITEDKPKPSKSTKVTKAKKPRTPAPVKELYFGPQVDDAIIRYNSETNDARRQLIYSKEIHKALEKLAENLIHVNKWYYTVDDTFEHAKQDVVTFLSERLYKYDKTKGKAFSYFDKIALNHLRGENKKGYKKTLQRKSIDYVDTDNMDILSERNQQQSKILSEFVDVFIDYMDVNIPHIYKKAIDQTVGYAIIAVFKQRESFEIFNKKIIYFCIREHTEASTIQITRMVSSFKKKFGVMFNDFCREGMINFQKLY